MNAGVLSIRNVLKPVVARWWPHGYLHAVERAVIGATRPSERPQLFIVGPPRTGTTLIYQYIAHRLELAHFTNGVGRFPMAPCLVTYAQRRRWGSYKSDFVSRYGKVDSALGPREAGAFWNRYFSGEAYQGFDDIEPGSREILRRTVWCIQRIFGDVPFVNKNVKHLLRINALKDIYPNGQFLVVERDLVDAAISMLRGRHEVLHDPTQWWSVRPPDYKDLKDLSPPEQIAGQYRSLTRKMDQDLATLSQDRVLRVSYGQFCRNPEALIDRIATRLGPVARKNGPVQSFSISKAMPESPDECALAEMIQHG